MLFEAACHYNFPTSAAAAASSVAMANMAIMDQKSHLLHQQQQQQQAQTSSRILYDIPCKVCTDHSSGKHYGIFACDGCAGFFKRSIRRNRQYVCKAKSEGSCLVDKTHRNQCRACRLQRCADVGMNKEAVQHERGPRNSTLRRQMSLYFKEHASSGPGSCSPPPSLPPAASSPVGQYSPPPHPHPPPPLHLSPFHALHAKPHFFVDPRLLAAAAAAGSPYFPAAAFQRHPGLLTPTPKYAHELSPPPPPMPPAASFSPPTLLSPLPPPPLQDSLSETAARLLFMNVRWAQQIPAFTSLPYRDQLTLLEETWRELFVLSAAQFALPVELAALPTDLALLGEIKAFQETIQKFQSMGVDATEFACLRAIVLLKTTLDASANASAGAGDAVKRELRDQVAINSLQDQAQLTLSQYIVKAYPGQPQRFGKLLLLLPSLKSVASTTIHSVFFKCIGAIPLEKLICDMFKAR